MEFNFIWVTNNEFNGHWTRIDNCRREERIMLVPIFGYGNNPNNPYNPNDRNTWGYNGGYNGPYKEVKYWVDICDEIKIPFYFPENRLVAIKKNHTTFHRTEIHMLTLEDNFQNFGFQEPSVLPETDDNWAFTSHNADIVAVKKNNTGTGSTEIHILKGDDGYLSYRRQTGTALPPTDDNWSFHMMDDDLVCIKKKFTGTNSTEVHILDGSDNFQSFKFEAGTALHETDKNWAFAVMGEHLVCIKKNQTASNTTEVHILDGNNNFDRFLLQTSTALHMTDDTWEFAMWENNLVCIKKSGTETNTTEVHILNGADNYQSFLLHTPTALPESF